jgi:FkbM family methyltransferase
MLRGMRPFALPLLNRLQLRMRQVVEEANLGAATQDLSSRLERIEAHLRGDSASLLAHFRELIVTLAPVGQLETRVRSLQIALDGLRLDQASANQAVQAGLGEARDREMRSREALDRLALDREMLGKQLGEVEARMAALVEARADGLTNFVGERTDGLHLASEGLAGVVRERAEMLRAATDGLTGFVGGRTEILLQRIAIPLGDAMLMRVPEGYLLVPSEDVALLTAMIESGGRLEPGTVAVIQGLLRKGDVMLDVGANVGLTVLPAARRVGPSGRVIAVEPGSRVAGLLRRSLAVNGMEGWVTLHACAAGEAPGRAALNIGAVSGHSSLLALPGADRTEEVEVRPLDELVEPGTSVRLVKIDVEGYEPEAWRGMRRIVAENPALAVLAEFGPEHLRRAGITPEAWLRAFTGTGATAYEVDEVTGALRPLRPLRELAALHTANLLFLRERPDAYPELRFA